jgi:two-component system NarL family sensor kinase
MSEKIFMLITFAGVIFLIICLTVFVYTMIVIYRRRQAEFDREELRIRMEVQERTAEQISQELHDNVAHEITLAKLHLKSLEPLLTDQAATIAGQISISLTKTFDSIRDISKSLSHGVINTEGLNVAISNQLDRLKGSLKYDIRYDVYGTYHYMDEKMEIVLYRIFQEAINNIVRHAQAKVITVTLECSVNQFILIIADDGQGFDLENANNMSNAGKLYGGLATMRERATLINAEFKVESQMGIGTKIKVILSLTNAIRYDR